MSTESLLSKEQANELATVVRESLGRDTLPGEVSEHVMQAVRDQQSLGIRAQKAVETAEDMVKRWQRSLTFNTRQRNAKLKELQRYVPGDDQRRKARDYSDAYPKSMSECPGHIPDESVRVHQVTERFATLRTRDSSSLVSGNVKSRSLYRVDSPLAPWEATGITGTPYQGGLAVVDTEDDMQPLNARGYLWNPGEYHMYHRSDSVAQECIEAHVGTLSSSTCEAVVPHYLTADTAARLGINRDAVARMAEEFNLAFHAGMFADSPNLWLQQAFRETLISGFSVFEILMRPEQIATRSIVKLAPRLPNTFLRWFQDPLTGEATFVQQVNPNGSVRQPSSMLDMSRCIHFVMGQLGDNFEGISGCRAARVWDLLTTELILAVILHVQRFGTGIPIVKRNSDAPNSRDASTSSLEALAKYQNIAEAAMEIGAGMDIDILQVQLQNANVEGIIEVCSRMKRAAFRASISGMGTGESSGSYNLADIQSQLWLKQMHAMAATFEAGMNKLIRYWCDARGYPMLVYPEFKITGFASRAASEVLADQQTFVTIAQRPMTEPEIVSLAKRADVVYDGRGEESQDAATLAAQNDAVARPDVSKLPPTTPPDDARLNAARALKAMADAEEGWKGLDTATDLRIARKIASGKPLTGYEMSMLQVWFESFGDPTMDTEWEKHGPTWQDYFGHGGDSMKEWLLGQTSDVDGVDADDSELDTDVTDVETNDEPDAAEVEATGVRSREAKRYEHINRTIPKAAKRNAKTGLEQRKKHGRGGTQVGWNRARDIINLSEFSVSEWREIYAWFERHEVDKQGEGWKPGTPGYPSAGRISWNLWGGDAMRAKAGQVRDAAETADKESRSRTATVHTCGAGCTHDAPGIRLKTRAKQSFIVETRTGKWRAWRELTPVERNVSWEQIEAYRLIAATRVQRAVTREQRLHRAAYIAQVQPMLDAIKAGTDRRAISTLSSTYVDWTANYERAILAELSQVSEWAAKDMAAEIASSVGAAWTPVPQNTPGSDPAAQVTAYAKSVSQTADTRMNETLRLATMQVASGAPASTLAVAKTVGVNHALGVQITQSVSETLNQTREAVVMRLGPEVTEAQFSALMDRWTCQECASRDMKLYKVGSPEYIRDTPPYRLCNSLTNSKGQANLCHCVWVYRYNKDAMNALTSQAGGLSLSTRSVVPIPAETNLRSATVTLVCGVPGSGKSTYAQTLVSDTTVVIDRDDFVLGDNGQYVFSGRAESILALADALREGKDVVYVACLLGPSSRQKMVEMVDGMTDGQATVNCVQVIADPAEVRRVNAARVNEERGSIPADQLEHLIDGWEMVSEDESFDEVFTIFR
jgi:hypothetical protein